MYSYGFYKDLREFEQFSNPERFLLMGGIFYPQPLGGTSSPCGTSTSDPSLTAASRSAAVTAFCASEVSFLRLSWHTTISQLGKLNIFPNNASIIEQLEKMIWNSLRHCHLYRYLVYNEIWFTSMRNSSINPPIRPVLRTAVGCTPPPVEILPFGKNMENTQFFERPKDSRACSSSISTKTCLNWRWFIPV